MPHPDDIREGQPSEEKKPQIVDEEDDDDEDDEDYVPSGDEKGLSEEESDEDVEDDVPGDEDDEGETKRGRKRKCGGQPASTEKHPKLEETLTEEEGRKRAEALWAQLNSDGDIKPSTTTMMANAGTLQVKKEETVKEESKPEEIQPSTSVTSQSPETKPLSITLPQVKKGGGLSSLVSKLSSKKKESTLALSKNDWERYKRDEGLEEELEEHTKSKDSYVEKQAFLQRADLKQFQVEKSIRDKMRARNTKP